LAEQGIRVVVVRLIAAQKRDRWESGNQESPGGSEITARVYVERTRDPAHGPIVRRGEPQLLAQQSHIQGLSLIGLRTQSEDARGAVPGIAEVQVAVIILGEIGVAGDRSQRSSTGAP